MYKYLKSSISQIIYFLFLVNLISCINSEGSSSTTIESLNSIQKEIIDKNSRESSINLEEILSDTALINHKISNHLYEEAEIILEDLFHFIEFIELSEVHAIKLSQFFRIISLSYFKRREYKTSEIILKKAISILTESGYIHLDNLYHLKFDLVKSIAYQDRYSKALDNANSLLNSLSSKRKNKVQEFEKLYFWMAMIQRAQGSFQQSLEFYKKFLSIRQSDTSQYDNSIANTYNNISLIQLNFGEYRKALENLKKAQKIYDNIPDTRPLTIARVNWRLGKSYDKLLAPDSALLYYEKAEKILHNYEFQSHPMYPSFQKDFADIFMEQGEIKKARYHYLLGLTNGIVTNCIYSVDPLNGLGKLEYDLGKWKEGLNHIQLALKCITKNDSLISYLRNPIITPHLPLPNEIFKSLYLKADILQGQSPRRK